MTIRQRRATIAFSALSLLTLAISSAQAQMSIQIRPDTGLASNQAALDAFNRAALQWTARLSDPITVYIDARLEGLGSGVLGQTSVSFVQRNFDTVRNSMVADSADEADDAIVSSLPTNATFRAALPTGFTLANRNGQTQLLATSANAKALGLLAANNSTNDGIISFSSNFNFDYDSRDGVGAGLFDFESIAAHEIGHLLGFISSVDDVDELLSQGQTGAIAPTTLDLFRFQNGTASDPSSAAEFATAERSLLTGGDAITDDIISEYRMSTGTSTGDGRQASHWKDNDITGTTIGIMDPTFGPGTVLTVGNADFRAMDLIGYDVVVTPEPSAAALLIPALTGILVVRKRRRTARSSRTKMLV